MGSDDLFKKKRKARNTKELKRQKDRKSYKRILIVCEGEKTEPNYFIGIRSYYRLHTANIEISGDKCGSDPKSIVEVCQTAFWRGKKHR
ncbi:RloB family protein [Neisseria chenwenguii]|uniref:RloB family protein n=1 Tax=Neisseria chenwenguii TaxID=1853278 RepID=UPI0018F4634F|nr:RloB family protein [Neisseria chenwenguii]